MKPEIIILCGPPGSGKSTYCVNYPNHIRVSQDDDGKIGHMQLFESALYHRDNIILDRMNFNKEQRNRYLLPAKKLGYKTKIIVLHVPKDISFSRCDARKDHPTVKTKEDASKAVNFFFSKYERVEDSEADVVERIYDIGVEKKSPAIWIDIDNTLSDNDHREHFLNNPEGKKDWKGFFKALGEDPVNEPIKAIANNFYENGKVEVLICTARPDDYRRDTAAWLKKHDIKYNRMIMRQRGDFRKDSIVKEMMLEFEIKPLHELLFSVDDRKDVIDRIRTHGVTVLDCAGEDGNF